MSDSLWENRWEKELNQHVAEGLGMSLEDVESLQFDVEANESNDGLIYGHILRFRVEECDPDALTRVPGLQDDWVMIAPIPEGPDES